MEEEDHNELLQYTDDDSLSESDDQCIPSEKDDERQGPDQSFVSHTKLEFIIVKILLVISSTFLVIILPLYLETINVKSDSYNMIFATTAFTTIVMLLIVLSMKYIICPEMKGKPLLRPPISWLQTVQVSFLLTVSGFIIIYAVDRKRVMCHLQDPIKGVILVFSLLYYFFFCKKLMGLQRIFSTTTIIVGLFISVDYGLCDEFKCRGREREHKSDDAGQWVWQTHTIWTSVYVVGIGLFAAFITVLDRFLLICKQESDATLPINLLSTVSRRISFPNSNYPLNNAVSSQRTSEGLTRFKPHTTIQLGLCIHLVNLIFVVCLFWTDLIPTIGKGSNMAEFFNYTSNSLTCHFMFASSKINSCGYVSLYSWPFLIVYLIFILAMLRFVTLTQSAVYTVATMATSLPLVGIWWSLFNMTTNLNDLIIWSPSVTGELICALLGLPVVVTGLCLLCKSHFKDCLSHKRQTSQINTVP